MSKKIKILFTISIILNVVFMGLIGGFAYKVWYYMPMNHPDIRNNLSPEARTYMREQGEDMRGALREKFMEAKTIREGLAATYSLETYEKSDFLENAGRYAALKGDIESIKLNYLATLGENLTADERSHVIKVFQHHERPHPFRSKCRGSRGSESDKKFGHHGKGILSDKHNGDHEDDQADRTR